MGTNVGIALRVPLPRLEGVPIISGRANISYHAHFGSVTFFLNLQHKVLTTEVCITSTLCFRNFQNVKLRLHGVGIVQNLTITQILREIKFWKN